MFDVPSRSLKRLTSDRNRRVEASPRFTAPNRVAFVADGGAIVELDLDRGTPHEVLRAGVYAFDFSPDRSALAYYDIREGDSAVVNVFSISRGTTRQLRIFMHPGGRGAFPESDETRVSWSPDGKKLLVQDTSLTSPIQDTVLNTSEGNTLFVLGLDGRDIVPPRPGTWARWGLDSRTIYYREFAGEGRWQALDTRDGSVSRLAMSLGEYPVLSPDGNLIAYDDGTEEPAVFVFDIATGKERKVAEGRVALLWLSASALAGTDVRPCQPDPGEEECSSHSPLWEETGTASSIEVASGKSFKLPVTSTLDAHVLYR